MVQEERKKEQESEMKTLRSKRGSLYKSLQLGETGN